MADIFISYRRETGEFLARCLYDELSKNGYNVFYDIESLNAGVFDEQIYQRIQESSDFLLLLTKDSLNRCKNDGDWVRQEIEYALKLNKNIIPILTRGFKFPELPETMKDLPRFQGVEATSGDMEIVIKRLQGYMSANPRNNGTNNTFSTLSVPAINSTLLDFIQKKGDFVSLLAYFTNAYEVTKVWRTLQYDLACNENQRDTGTQDLIKSLSYTASVLFNMGIISSAPSNEYDLWEDVKIINPAAMQELLVSARTYVSLVANCNFTSTLYKLCVRSRVRSAFVYQEQTFYLLDVIENNSKRYAIAIHNTDELLPEHTVFQVNPDSSLVKLEWNMKICKEVFLTCAGVYRMISPLPYCYDDDYYNIYINIFANGNAFFGTIVDFLRNIPKKTIYGYWKPKGSLGRKIYISADPKDHSNMYYERKHGDFITENGKEAVFDVVEVTPNSRRSREADYYVLSVPITKADKWLNEPHIRYVKSRINENNSLENELTMERVEKTSAFLTEEILERFALIMQVYRQSGLFTD